MIDNSIIPIHPLELTLSSIRAEKLKRVHLELARRGNLRHLLDQTQQEGYDLFYNSKHSTVVLEWARQTGKSFLLGVLAIEQCIRHPDSRVAYVAKTAKAGEEVIAPNLRAVIRHLPPELVPTWKISHLRFPNGSIISIFGADDERTADRGRGPRSHLNLVDEAGFISILEYLMNSILVPQTRRTKGKTVLSSSPPLTKDHHFCKIADQALENSSYLRRDIYSPGMQTIEEKEEYIKRMAHSMGMSVEELKDTPFFQREFMALRVIDDNIAVVPEFFKNKRQIVTSTEIPEAYHIYTACDPGLKDKTGILIAYHDFEFDKVIITDELLLTKADTKTIVDETSRKVQERFGEHPVKYNVIDDNTGRLVNDIWTYHKARYISARKDDRDAAINAMRLQFRQLKVSIDPRCRLLIAQLENAVYKNIGSDDFLRTDQGHYDLVDACIYLLRHIDRHLNPFKAPLLDPSTHAWREPPKQPNILLGDSNIAKAYPHKD